MPTTATTSFADPLIHKFQLKYSRLRLSACAFLNDLLFAAVARVIYFRFA